ncbi:MFS transporter [Dongia soli]|uniref:MFS transporter n=1 Tax=Dongia soli TaxID=600628 RepID=A0ABU5ECX1_9PROT|nr:MFS transporter [Dongia soli]MDY0884189.1 MFS transporter [Dongia soli]
MPATITALLVPLNNKLYRNLWMATLLSNFGVWIQSVAAAWLMTSIAPSVGYVAWVQAATSLPPLLFTLLGGVLADRFDQRLIFLIAQTIVLAVALTLSIFQHFGLVTPWMLLGLTFALDSGSALRYPAYQTTVAEILPRSEVPNALILSSIGWNIGRVVGPGIGGAIIAIGGVPAAFAVNALCNVYIIGVLLQWRRRSRISKTRPAAGIASEVLSGLAHVLAVPQIRATMLCCFVFCLFAAGLWALLPLVVKHMVGGEASIYGAMLGAIGVGALFGALLINWTRRTFGLRLLFLASTAAFAISTAALALLQSVPLLMIALAFGGIGWMMAMSTFNVVVQMAAGDGFKGRAVSIYYVALFGGIALGSWLWGHVAEEASIQAGLLASAAGLFANLILYRPGTRLAAHFDAASSS